MKRSSVILFLALTALASLSVTSQSLWYDEVFTAWLASQRSLGDLAHFVLGTKNSDIQWPLYLIFIWGWAKIFGVGEYALRSSNIPFALIFVSSLGWTSLRVFGRPFLWTVFCISPFFLYYMNEARGYVPVMAMAAASVAALLAYFSDQQRFGRIAPWVCLSALTVACGLLMLAVFLIPLLLVCAFCSTTEKHLEWRAVLRDWRGALSATLPLLLVLGDFYAWTVYADYGGKRSRLGIANPGYALYEFMGYGGLGPPRYGLHGEIGLHTFLPYWPWLTAGVLASLAAVIAIATLWRQSCARSQSWGLLAGLCTGVALFLVAAALAHFRFWGRHLAVFFPPAVFWVIQLTSGIGISPRLRAKERLAFLFLALVWAISDARLVLDHQYAKEDYRFAAAFALSEARRTGGEIAWAAPALGARYYGIELAPLHFDAPWPVKGQGRGAANWTNQQIRDYFGSRREGSETILVLGRQDASDHYGAWAAAVKSSNAREIASPNSFNIYAFGP